jgi:flagellar motor protein MotB
MTDDPNRRGPSRRRLQLGGRAPDAPGPEDRRADAPAVPRDAATSFGGAQAGAAGGAGAGAAHTAPRGPAPGRGPGESRTAAILRLAEPLLLLATEITPDLPVSALDELKAIYREEIRRFHAAAGDLLGTHRADQASIVLAALVDDVVQNASPDLAARWKNLNVNAEFNFLRDAGTMLVGATQAEFRSLASERGEPELLELLFLIQRLGFLGALRRPGANTDSPEMDGAARQNFRILERHLQPLGKRVAENWAPDPSIGTARARIPAWIFTVAGLLAAGLIWGSAAVFTAGEAADARARIAEAEFRTAQVAAAPAVPIPNPPPEVRPAPPPPPPPLFVALQQLAADVGPALTVTGPDDGIRLQVRQLFAPGSWEPTEADRALMRRIVEILGRYASSGVVCVEGHTDTVPVRRPRQGVRNNMDLSERRAQAIAELLGPVSQARPGILVASIGFGDTRLAERTPPNTDEPRNRRVEVLWRDGPPSLAACGWPQQR